MNQGSLSLINRFHLSKQTEPPLLDSVLPMCRRYYMLKSNVLEMAGISNWTYKAIAERWEH